MLWTVKHSNQIVGCQHTPITHNTIKKAEELMPKDNLKASFIHQPQLNLAMSVVTVFLMQAIVPMIWTLPTANLHTARSPKFPFQDPKLPWDQRADDLVARLTLEEIVPQTLAGLAPAIPRLDIHPYVWDTECIRGQASTNTTAFPQALGLAATFR